MDRLTSAGPMLAELTMVAVLKPDLLHSLTPAYIERAQQDRDWMEWPVCLRGVPSAQKRAARGRFAPFHCQRTD